MPPRARQMKPSSSTQQPPTTIVRDARTRADAIARVGSGQRVSAVAAELGVHPSTVRRWIKAAAATPPRDPFMAALLQLPDQDDKRALRVSPEPTPFALTPVTLEPVILDPVVLEPVFLFPEADDIAAARAREREVEREREREAARDRQRESVRDTAGVVGPEPEAPAEVDAEPTSALEQLQVIASAPGDAIVRFGQKLPMLDRFALVVAAWLVCLFIAWVAPESHPGRGFLVALHLLAMTVAFGSVMALDWHGILWERRQREIRESIRLSHALSPLIWAGLGVLFLTGALLGPDLTSPFAWFKLISVLALALNGVATSALRRHLVSATADGLRSLAPGPRRQVVVSSLLSQACWLIAVLIGLSTTMSR
ncbi:MAG: helix-turn-helix domain-containing protein [Knoellia sp.]